jgi:putative FmdB family regulatory protein
MPTYQYRCTECGRDLEVVQKFSDASLTECPTCSGQLRVVFKGTGFYRTDSRAGGNGSDSGGAEKKAADKEKSGDKSSEKTSEKSGSTPAKTESGSGSGTPAKVAAGTSGSSSTGSKAATS